MFTAKHEDGPTRVVAAVPAMGTKACQHPVVLCVVIGDGVETSPVLFPTADGDGLTT